MITVGASHRRRRIARTGEKYGQAKNKVRFLGFLSWKFHRVQRVELEVDKGLGFH